MQCGIQAELWKKAGEGLHDELFKLIKDIYNKRELPLDFAKSKIIPILKRTTANKCELYYTISLLTHVSKILTKIMSRRMENKIKAILSKISLGLERTWV